MLSVDWKHDQNDGPDREHSFSSSRDSNEENNDEEEDEVEQEEQEEDEIFISPPATSSTPPSTPTSHYELNETTSRAEAQPPRVHTHNAPPTHPNFPEQSNRYKEITEEEYDSMMNENTETSGQTSDVSNQYEVKSVWVLLSPSGSTRNPIRFTSCVIKKLLGDGSLLAVEKSISDNFDDHTGRKLHIVPPFICLLSPARHIVNEFGHWKCGGIPRWNTAKREHLCTWAEDNKWSHPSRKKGTIRIGTGEFALFEDDGKVATLIVLGFTPYQDLRGKDRMCAFVLCVMGSDITQESVSTGQIRVVDFDSLIRYYLNNYVIERFYKLTINTLSSDQSALLKDHWNKLLDIFNTELSGLEGWKPPNKAFDTLDNWVDTEMRNDTREGTRQNVVAPKKYANKDEAWVNLPDLKRSKHDEIVPTLHSQKPSNEEPKGTRKVPQTVVTKLSKTKDTAKLTSRSVLSPEEKLQIKREQGRLRAKRFRDRRASHASNASHATHTDAKLSSSVKQPEVVILPPTLPPPSVTPPSQPSTSTPKRKSLKRKSNEDDEITVPSVMEEARLGKLTHKPIGKDEREQTRVRLFKKREAAAAKIEEKLQQKLNSTHTQTTPPLHATPPPPNTHIDADEFRQLVSNLQQHFDTITTTLTQQMNSVTSSLSELRSEFNSFQRHSTMSRPSLDVTHQVHHMEISPHDATPPRHASPPRHSTPLRYTTYRSATPRNTLPTESLPTPKRTQSTHKRRKSPLTPERTPVTRPSRSSSSSPYHCRSRSPSPSPSHSISRSRYPSRSRSRSRSPSSVDSHESAQINREQLSKRSRHERSTRYELHPERHQRSLTGRGEIEERPRYHERRGRSHDIGLPGTPREHVTESKQTKPKNHSRRKGGK